MATIDDPIVIRQILENRGVFRCDDGEDPPAEVVLRYRNPWGGISVAVAYTVDDYVRYMTSPTASEVCELMIQGDLTDAGRAFIEAVRAGKIRDLPHEGPL